MDVSGRDRINRVLLELLPFGIVQMEHDERKLRREIEYAFRNIHGVRVGSCTTSMAFEAVVKKEIAKLKEPSLTCVDLVVVELFNVIRICTDNMLHFPKLKKAVQHIFITHVRGRAQHCKEYLGVLIDCELAYINTNHEDFLSAQNQSARTLRAGSVCFLNRRGVPKNYWFVLTSENISWYKEHDERKMKYMLPLNVLKLKNVEQGFLCWRHTFAIFNPNEMYIYKNYKQLELSFLTVEEMNSWKESFLRAGVCAEGQIPEDNRRETFKEKISGSTDPHLERQVTTVQTMVNNYMKIVTKTIKDLVPKTIMCMIINSTKDFFKRKFLSLTCIRANQLPVIEEETEEEQVREATSGLFYAAEEVLRVIGAVSVRPLIENDWFANGGENAGCSGL